MAALTGGVLKTLNFVRCTQVSFLARANTFNSSSLSQQKYQVAQAQQLENQRCHMLNWSCTVFWTSHQEQLLDADTIQCGYHFFLFFRAADTCLLHSPQPHFNKGCEPFRNIHLWNWSFHVFQVLIGANVPLSSTKIGFPIFVFQEPEIKNCPRIRKHSYEYLKIPRIVLSNQRFNFSSTKANCEKCANLQKINKLENHFKCL